MGTRDNIVYQQNGKWYFWDETWSDSHGPFDTKEECDKALDQYIAQLMGD